MAPSTLALAAACALVTGLTLGVIGGGGSVLTVPVFVYLLGYPAKEAIAMSLPVIGATSLIGAIGHWRRGNVQLRTALAFGAVAMAGSFAGARLSQLVDGRFQLALLGLMMGGAALSMLRSASTTAASDEPAPQRPLALIAAAGIAVGILTGLVGVGGGFLIVPALVLLGGVPMKQAIGTSLAVITMNTLAGFAGYAGQVHIDWTAMGLFAGVAIAGILLGTRLVAHVSVVQLKRGFAFFLLAVAAFVLFQSRAILLGR